MLHLRTIVRGNAAIMPDRPLVPIAISYAVVVATCVLSRFVEKIMLGVVNRNLPNTYDEEPIHSFLFSPLSVSMQFPFVRVVVVLVATFVNLWSVIVFEDAFVWAFVWITSVAFVSVSLTPYFVWQHDVQSGVLAFVTLPAYVLLLTQFVRLNTSAADAWIALLVLRLVLTLGGFVTYPSMLRHASKKNKKYLPALMSIVEYGIFACDVATLCLVTQPIEA